jgi:hypothetical protein
VYDTVEAAREILCQDILKFNESQNDKELEAEIRNELMSYDEYDNGGDTEVLWKVYKQKLVTNQN